MATVLAKALLAAAAEDAGSVAIFELRMEPASGAVVSL